MSATFPTDPTPMISAEVQFRAHQEHVDRKKLFRWLVLLKQFTQQSQWSWKMGHTPPTFNAITSPPYFFFTWHIVEAHYSTSVETIARFFTEQLKHAGLYGPVEVARVTIEWRKDLSR